MDYELKLTQAELQVVFQGLGELPLKVSIGLLSKLQILVNEQDIAKAIPITDVVSSL